MPTSIGIYTCRTCHKNFKAKSDRFYSCPCGASCIKPSELHYSSYSHTNGHLVDPVEGQTYYLAEDFTALSPRGEAALAEIKRIQAQTGQKYHMRESTEAGENGETFLRFFSVSTDRYQDPFTGGRNRLTLSLNFRENHADRPFVERRLIRFLSFMEQIENQTMDLSDTSQMRGLAVKLRLRETIQQLKPPEEIYHYIFYV